MRCYKGIAHEDSNSSSSDSGGFKTLLPVLKGCPSTDRRKIIREKLFPPPKDSPKKEEVEETGRRSRKSEGDANGRSSNLPKARSRHPIGPSSLTGSIKPVDSHRVIVSKSLSLDYWKQFQEYLEYRGSPAYDEYGSHEIGLDASPLPSSTKRERRLKVPKVSGKTERKALRFVDSVEKEMKVLLHLSEDKEPKEKMDDAIKEKKNMESSPDSLKDDLPNVAPSDGRWTVSSHQPLKKRYPFRSRLLTGKVKTIRGKFERGIEKGGISPPKSDSDDNRMALWLSSIPDTILPRSYLTVNSRGDLVWKGPPDTPQGHNQKSDANLDEKEEQRLGTSLRRHDEDLDLLVREGEPVSSHLRNILSTSLRSPYRRPISTDTNRYPLPDRPSRLPLRSYHRSDQSLEDLRSGRPDFSRSQSLSDIRLQADRTSRRTKISSTPLQPRRDLVGTSPLPIRDLSPIRSQNMDDSELYRLEEETRNLQDEVMRLNTLLNVSAAERDQLSLKFSTFSDHVAEEYQDYQSKLQNYKDINQKQSSLIDRLANKLREYKSRCRELDSRATEGVRVREDAEREIETLNIALAASEERLRAAEAQHGFDLETAIIKLEEEENRCESLSSQVASVQEKLTKTEKALAEIQEEKDKLQQSLRKSHEETKVKEAHWNEQAQNFNSVCISKHKNLLDLWREVGSVKRNFGEVKRFTVNDLASLKNALDQSFSSVKAACKTAQGDIDTIPESEKHEFMMSTTSDLWGRIQECERAQIRAETEKTLLKEKVSELTGRISELNNTLRDRDRSIQDLNRKLEDGITEADVQESLREKARTLETYLVEVAHSVIKDAEQSTAESDGRTTPSVAFKLTRDPDQGFSPDLPQSTVSAVRTALSNRQVQIHDLQLKLSSAKEQLINVRKQYESAECTQSSLEAAICELRDELEMTNRLKDDISREKDRLRDDLESVSSEKASLEKLSNSLKAQLQSVAEEQERQLRQIADLEKEKVGVFDERLYLASKLTKEKDETQRLLQDVNALTSELAASQQQVASLTDNLSKARVFEERFDFKKEEFRGKVRDLERTKADLEGQISFFQRQEVELREALEQAETFNISINQDKSQLVSRLSALEAERATTNTERIEFRAEIERLKDEIEALEDERSNLEVSVSSLNEKLSIMAVEKEKIELELTDVIGERNEIHGHLTNVERARSSLEADLEAVTCLLEERNKLIEQLNLDKEGLTKENAEMEVRLAGVDKEINSLRENLASSKAEKQSLETFSNSLEKKWSSNESRRTQLEKENQHLITDKERLTTQMNKLQRELETELTKFRDAKSGLERKLDEMETEHKKIMTSLKDEKEEIIDDLRKEKNDLQSDFEDKLNSSAHTYKQDLEELEAKKELEILSLRRTLDKIQRERDDSSLRYEEEKHKSLTMAHQEIASLEEKVANLQRDISHYEGLVEALRREGTSKAEAGRVSESTLHAKISQLKEELHSVGQSYEKKSKLDKESYEKKLKEVSKRLEEMRREHDMEANALRTDLRLSKEDTMRFQQDLEDAEAKLKDAQETRIGLKKEIERMAEDLRVSEEKRTHEAQVSAKKVDSERKELHKKVEERDIKIGTLEVTEAKHAELITRMTAQLRELSALKQDNQREISDFKRKLQVLETDGLNKAKEIENLRQRLTAEEDRHNESRKEASKLKAKLVEYERDRDSLQTELALLERRLSEMENHHAAKEQELASSLQESRSNEKKLTDEKKNLETYLSNATQQISDLKIKLSREEGHVDALEEQLSTLESSKEVLERKLHNIYSSLRTVTRMYQDEGPGRGRKGKFGLDKSPSQADLDSFDKVTVTDIDPETIRHELRSLMNQMNQLELERDDAIAKVVTLERQLSELQEAQQKSEARLRDVTRTLSELEEKKRYTEDKLNKSSSLVTQHEDVLRRKEGEIRNITEEFSNLKRKATDLELERNTLNDRVQKLKSCVGRLEMENSEVKERMRAAEQRLSLIDDSKGRLESDLNSLKKALNEKQLEIESMRGSNEAVNRNMRVLEDQNAALKNKIDEAKNRVSLASSSEADLKDKLSQMNRSMKEQMTTSSTLQEELSRCLNQLSRNENDRRQLEDKLVEAQSTVADLRRQKDHLTDSKSKLQQDLANIEIKNAELEMTLKSVKGNLGERSSTADELISKVVALEQERVDLRTKVAELERKLITTQAEKRDYEKMETRHERETVDLKKYLEKGLPIPPPEPGISTLRIETMELRRKIDTLETEKTELQQKHLKENLELSSDHRKERQLDHEKIRRLSSQLETLRQEKERCILRIHALEQQINQYREQIREYRSRSSAVAADVRKVRMSMTESLHNIGAHPRISTSVVDSEIQGLSSSRSPGRPPTSVMGTSGRQSRHSVSPRRRGDQQVKRTTFAPS